MSSAPPLLAGFEHINRYWDKQHNIFAAKILPGEFYVSMHGELITTVLGSCVSACIRDKVTGIGGMNHFMLPDNRERSRSSAWENTPVSAETRYGNVAMERLINVILASGGKRKNLEIKLFGGGRVLNINTDIGGKNVDFVKHYLQKEGLRIESEDTRGFWPRKVQYFPLTGRVRIKRLNSVHNDTLTRRELEYLKTLKEKKIEGKVDLF
ncbi:MAG: chemoreceptor glutamine deamidase CheD [Gammaproteobacteria bacterium]|nr:chemoreceptor glutamine deamidase CheD [Gammaproteobacteria bacterium]